MLTRNSLIFFFSSRRRHTRSLRDWNSDVCSSDLVSLKPIGGTPGDATADQMDLIADLAERYSQSEVRVSHEQNLIFPHVAKDDLPELFAILEKNRSEEHTSELQSRRELVCRLLLE